MSRSGRILLPLIVLACGILGFLLVNQAASPEPRKPAPLPAKSARAPRTDPRPTKAAVRDEFPDGTTVELFSTLNPGEIILRFPSDASYGSFFAALAGSRVRLIAQLDRLRALRIGYDDQAELEALLAGEHLTAYQGITRVPELTRPGGGVSQDAAPFGHQLMSWLGAAGDRSRWGQGVKVAVLDTGTVPHPSLPRSFQSIALVPFPADPATTHFHGTAVASLIAGQSDMAAGLAPAVDLLSIRIADESGRSDSFWTAAGILAAMDAGAEIINLSMGSTDPMPLAADAVKMAQDAGVLIVASAGNEGLGESRYPAACPDVVSVGAIDAKGRRMAFSNLSNTLSLVAPGYGIVAASPTGGYLQVSGTSASAPLVTGAIAATMSDGSGRRLSAAEALKIVFANTDDAGYPGPDTEFGRGILNVGRIMRRDVPGIADAAITDQRIVASGAGEVRVTVQNRGTIPLINTLVEVATPAGTTPINLTTLPPGQIGTVAVPFDMSSVSGQAPVEIRSSAILGNGDVDVTPENNFRSQGFRKR